MTPKNIASLALAAIMVTPAARDGAVHAQALSPVAFFERLVLTHFYRATNGPDWIDNANWLTDAPVGEWHGVAVDEEGRVTGLRLDANRLSGTIPPALANLAKLESLSLGLNQLSGEIPSELAGLTELTWLGLHGNRLSGPIPPELVRLSSLTSLWLSDNQLSGSIPRDLDRLTALRELVLSRNRLSGEVPPSLGNLANLQRLALGGNRLRGSIPPELANLANLTTLNLSRNQLSGEVLPSLGNLANLERLALGGNLLSGPIPPQLGNLANLERLVLSFNQLSGEIPPELGRLANLTLLSLYKNLLSGEIPSVLATLVNLTELWLGANRLSGPIPPDLGNLVNLEVLGLSRNRSLSGSIPPELGNLANLTSLRLDGNQLSGEIPPELGHLANLTTLRLNDNQLSGAIPPQLGNLANLSDLKLATNWLSGTIPAELGHLPDLSELWLDANRLSGPIPPQLGNLASLTSLRLNNNRLSGEIPPELGNLANLTELRLQANRLGGEIPPQLGYLASLTSLQLGHNQLSGEIPPELANLVNLEVLRLEANRLSGEMPPGLADLPNLRALLVWGNQLSGALPDALAPVRVTPETGMSPPFAGPIAVVLTEAFGGRKFDQPTEIGAYPAEPGGAGRGAFVAEREGRILLLHPDGGEAAELLDIRDRVLTTGGQDGLISVALDPRFEETGHLWLCYSVQDPALWARLSRFTVDLQDRRRADPGSELVVLDVPQPFLGHGCGSIRFGPDGMLYLGLGDGVPGGDPWNHGQNPGTLLGSVIRIDASRASADAPYAVPPDNPFVDTEDVRPEIWAYGFRNPWRMAFDPATGALWLGDVGEGDIEEIDLIEAGGNYGWNRLEGTRCHNPPDGCDPEGTVPPVAQYVHEIGCAVAGGVVYRGRAVPALVGHYLFADWCTRRLWALPVDGGDVVEIGVTPRPVSGFAADAEGEVYLATFGGAALRIAPPES